jgi:hypothetical protein
MQRQKEITKMTDEVISWRDLLVTDSDGLSRNLGMLVDTNKSLLSGVVMRDGKISEWKGFFISAPREEPSPDTPSVPVDWSGFGRHVPDGWLLVE